MKRGVLNEFEIIEREDLRKSVIAEMLKCDMILTELAERQMKLLSRR